MKSNVSSIDMASDKPQLHYLTRLAASFVSSCALKIRTGFSNFHTRLQIGRMESVLGNLSDEQLAKVGVKRSGIKRHAEYLVGSEYDGL